MKLSSSTLFRRGLAAGAAVIVLGGAAVGIATAQAQPATPTTQQAPSGYQAFLNALATRLKIAPADLQSAITQARSDAGMPAGGGFPGRGPAGARGPAFGLNAAATFLGVTPQALRTELQTKSLTQAATDHGKNPGDLATALKNEAHTQVDAQVTAGRLTATDAATRKTQIDQRIDQMMTQVLSQGRPGGPGAPGAPGGPAGVRGPGFELNTAATFLGVTPEALRTELQTKSLAQTATDHGKAAADLATALKNAANSRIDAQVTAGQVTASDAATRKTQVDQRIDQMMTQTRPQGRPGASSEISSN